MIEKTDIELKIVDSVDTSHSIEEVLADSASNPDAFYVGQGYLAKNGEKIIESIDKNGTYPNVTVGNATKATSADTATRANTAATAATAVNISDAPVLTATEDEQITVKVGNKTSNALTVPYAQRADFATDLSGRVEATPEVFTYRPSAGDKSIKDDNAFIRRVKGNSLVWNQLVKNGNFATTTDWSPYQSVNVSLNWDNGLTVTSNYAGTGGDQISVRQAIAQPFILGHRYFVHFEFSTSNSSLKPLLECFGALYSDENRLDYVQSGNHYYSINNVKATRTTHCYLKAVGTKAVGDTWTFKNVMIIDLTAMFGTGNEPTTVEEFRALFPDSYYPYNAGELRNLNCYGIKTVGFNQWDGNTQVGYINDKTGLVTSSSSYLCTDFIRVIPNQEYYINTEQTAGRWGAWYDANKNHIAGILNYDQIYTAPSNAAYIRLTIKTADSGNPDTFCINLHHTGYRDGEYEPYKAVTHELPLSKITNGEPLRKAGSVYDEINETEYIRRVGIVDLGSLTWSYYSENNFFVCYNIPNMKITNTDSERLDGLFCAKYPIDTNVTVSTQATDKTMKRHSGWLYIRDTSFTSADSFRAAMAGVILNYELDEPIVSPIETPIDFNYYVEDFGTEEALLAENSAPFSADIVYQFNATDQVRNNTRNIQRLQKSVFTPSGTASQYIRGDGSYADVSELANAIPIYDGEKDSPEESEYNLEIRLFPQQYAKPAITLDADNNPSVLIRMEAPDNTGFVAEYWLELEIGESIPEIQFGEPDDDSVLYRINGDILKYAVNIIHIITTDGGMRYFGEIKSYLIE